jgi:hypothetical protein
MPQRPSDEAVLTVTTHVPKSFNRRLHRLRPASELTHPTSCSTIRNHSRALTYPVSDARYCSRCRGAAIIYQPVKLNMLLGVRHYVGAVDRRRPHLHPKSARKNLIGSSFMKWRTKTHKDTDNFLVTVALSINP